VTRRGVANHVPARLRKRGKRDCRLSTPRSGHQANRPSVVAPAGLTAGDSAVALLIVGETVSLRRLLRAESPVPGGNVDHGDSGDERSTQSLGG